MKSLLIAGDYCKYNLFLIKNAVEELSQNFDLRVCLDFSVSLSIFVECTRINCTFEAYTSRKDLGKYNHLNSLKSQNIKFLLPNSKDYYERVLQNYFEILKTTDLVLFLTFSNKSHIAKVAEFAVDANKNTFCIPGDISNRFCSGSNFLLKTGNSTLLTSFEDLKFYV